MTKYKVNDEVIVYWKEKELSAKIIKINNDNSTVKLLWPEKSKNGKLLVSLKFPIFNYSMAVLFHCSTYCSIY